ncbi:MAG: hypothetical protein E6J54_31595 [Deltaproteobacteria bacterium]|nr:MAG: hypothetical protein E6J54_31595 [Deltaproteobacteria bacterium]
MPGGRWSDPRVLERLKFNVAAPHQIGADGPKPCSSQTALHQAAKRDDGESKKEALSPNQQRRRHVADGRRHSELVESGEWVNRKWENTW